jgi:peroxiredoxin
VAQLRQHAAELSSLNAQVVAISFGTALGAQTWLKETGAPFTFLAV